MLRKSLAVMALVLLSACGGDPEPKEPPPTPSATPATAPEMPAEASEESDEGAAAFVAYYIESMNYSVNHGLPEPLTALSSETCESCRSYIETIEADAKRGTTIRGFHWAVVDQSVGSRGSVDVAIDADEYEVHEPGDKDWSRVESARYELGLSLKYGDSRWIVIEMYLPEADG